MFVSRASTRQGSARTAESQQRGLRVSGFVAAKRKRRYLNGLQKAIYAVRRSCIIRRFVGCPMTTKGSSEASESLPQPSSKIPIVVATSVMLTFISFWRAAAIVLCDLGSSAYYVGGIAEQSVGKVASWFILGVMCFSYAV